MPVACLSIDQILCIQKGFEHPWGLKIRTVLKGSNLKQQSTYFVLVSGSSYGHPQSVEHPRSRGAQKNPSAGSGSCVFEKCGGGRLHVLLIHCTIFFLLKDVTFFKIRFDLFCSLWLFWRRKWLKLIMWQSMKIQISTDNSWSGHCIPVVFASQTWLQMLFQWYANVPLYCH